MNAQSEWQRVTALFDALVDVTTSERERVLETAALQDASVVHEVRTLLAAHGAADGRFDRPLLRLTPNDADAPMIADPLLRAGRVGVFNIVRKIGEGGMGAVYEATRGDTNYEQRVAIKTIARSGGSAVIASRFRRERQILAGLQHPNIAVLLDGGVTDDGTPYFVMEYVDGLPLDEWCRSRTLTISQRLDLMQQVSRGVQHAHQRLVVHRDLKPQNVFVSRDGVVKLLDFGIAKLMETSASDGPNINTVTQDGPSPLTAAYASPEQLRGDPVSTAGDVYSLGVMLYELLADVPPFPSAGRTAQQLADDVLNTTPPPPSAVCTDAAARACGEGNRARLASRLVGELDAIVMMAMRKEPERRYASVEAFAADIQRFLRRLPVAARPDTVRYRVQRYVSRNRWLATMSAMLAIVAILSAAAIWRQTVLSNREARRTARVAEFLQGVLGAGDLRVTGGVLPRLGPNASMGALLDAAFQRVAAEFPDDAAVRARLYLTIGSSRISQSRMRAAAEVLDSAIVLSRLSEGEQSDVFVLANLNAGSAALHRNRLAEAHMLTRAAEQALVARGDTVSELYAHALTDLSAIALVTGAYDTMTTLATRALAIETRRTTAPTIAKGIALNRLGMAALLTDQWVRGDSLFNESLATLGEIVSPSNLEHVDVQFKRETVALHFGRITQADSMVTTGLTNAIATFGANSREHAMWLAQQAAVATARGDLSQARRVGADAVRIIDSIPEVVSLVRADIYESRAAVSIAQRDWSASDSLLRIALRELIPLKRGLPLVTVSTFLGIILVHENRLAQADSQLAYAQMAYDSTTMRIAGSLILLHSSRAYLHDRAGDSTGVAREIAQVPVAIQGAVRAFIAQQRILDARDGRAHDPPSSTITARDMVVRRP